MKGLNPSEIRRRSRPNTSALAVTLNQLEDIKVDGKRRYSRFSGAPAKSPEQLMEDKDYIHSLEIRPMLIPLFSEDYESNLAIAI